MSIRCTPSEQAEALVKWAKNTFDCLVEAVRSAPNEGSKKAMLHIIEEFRSGLQMPHLRGTTELTPDEYRTWMDDWEQAQGKFDQWAVLSRMAGILSTINCLLDLGAEGTEKRKRGVLPIIEKVRSEWLQMPNLEEMGDPEVADEYKTLMDEWERVEHRFQEWRLHEIQTVGSA